MKKPCPCKDCHDRTVTCHGFCQRYKEWKGTLEEASIARQKELDKYSNPKRSAKNMRILQGIK